MLLNMENENSLNVPWKITDQMKILGIVIGKNKTEGKSYDWNFADKLNQCRTICNDWRNRNLSLKGKVTIINSLMVPLLLFPCSVTHVPAKVFRKFKKVTNVFLLGSGVNRVAHDTMCLSIDQGGMNLLDLETMFKATTVQWVKRFCHDDCQKWTLYLRDLVKSKGSLFDVFLEKNRKRYRQIQSPFYKKLFMIWSEMYCREPDSVLEFQNDSIWNNDYVLTRGEHFNWTHWMDAGIRQFRDILNEKGKLLTHIEIQERFGIKCDFLAIGRIKSAVPWPKFWGSDIQTEAGYQLLFPASESGPVDVLQVGGKGAYSRSILMNRWHKIAVTEA